MCARCEELEEEIAALKRQIGVAIDASEIDRLRSRFRLSRQQAWLLASLYRAGGKVLSKDVIINHMPTRLDDGLDRDPSQANTIICILRSRTGRDWIENVWGDGYKLTDIGRAKVAEALTP